jgi:hypothetical protein
MQAAAQDGLVPGSSLLACQHSLLDARHATNLLTPSQPCAQLQMERRERLRRLWAEREAAGEELGMDGAPVIGQVCVCVRGRGNKSEGHACGRARVSAAN